MSRPLLSNIIYSGMH